MAAQLLLGSTQKRIKTTVLCATQAQAEAVDEFIWQYPPDAFIGHNLYGEGPAAGTLAEIVWQSAYASMTSLRNKALVINLSGEFIDEYAKIKHIVDFVPIDEQHKEAARTRYKRYKQAGCQLEYKSA
jgi:DNA polymerase-3 subunit chi